MLAVALTLALVSPASLDGDAAFTAGVRAYAEAEYEQAILRFEEVSARSDLTPPDRALALVWLGLAYGSNADFDAAARHFKDALRIDPNSALPPDVSPRIVEIFTRAKTDAAAAVDVEAGQKEPPPLVQDPPVQPEPTKKDGSALLSVAGIGVGAAVALSGAVLCIFAAGAYGESTDTNAFAETRHAAYDRSVGLGVAGGVTAGVGVLIAGGGATLLALGGD